MDLSGAEWRIMTEVWRHPSVTARQVHDALAADTEWAYSTVKTMMTRLVEKGALAMSRDGKQSVFVAVITQEAARSTATSSLIDRVFEGAVGGLFQHLLGSRKVSAKDREQIRQLLEREK